ncbi:MAG: hypothetical protein ACI9HH_001008 [Pseudomonadota bacterium]
MRAESNITRVTFGGAGTVPARHGIEFFPAVIDHVPLLAICPLHRGIALLPTRQSAIARPPDCAAQHRNGVRDEGPRMNLADSWDAESGRWIEWARRPGHDSYWRYHRDQFITLLPPPGLHSAVQSSVTHLATVMTSGGCR